ncbi:MAG: hypothetical protein A3E85_06070 [Gammaproteobacteria bacterium RIFCSPHIGHO2_12_FULL_45_12]|nr:MAG: hypothetical protein A3E85_06070 [Gammaproteobacteria bacterium RIFCSPHIGHO2_12_FULL_45_12]
MMSKRNLELDKLRAFAVVMTIVVHAVRVFFPWSFHPDYVHGSSVMNIWANSWTGVDLFFVISGFIISKMIVEKIDELKNSPQGLAYFVKNFFLRRIYRIYPVAWIVFMFVLICAAFFNQSGQFGTFQNTIEAGISIFTYTFNYYFAYGSYKALTLSPYWSLAVEEQFYLIFPLFLIFTTSNRQRVLILLAAILMITFFIRPFSKFESLFLTQSRCDGLLYGCLVYYLSIQAWFKQLFSRVENNVFSSTLTLLLVLVLSSVTALGFSNNIVIPLACLVASVLVGLSAMEKNVISVYTTLNPISDYLGSRSYSLYIIHFPMMTCTQEIMYRASQYYHFKISSDLTVAYILLASMLTILGAEILYRYVEVPFIKKGRILFGASNVNVKQDEKILGLQGSFN